MSSVHLHRRDSAAVKRERDPPRPWSMRIPERPAIAAFLSDTESSSKRGSGIRRERLVVSFACKGDRKFKSMVVSYLDDDYDSLLPTVQRDLGRLSLSSLPPPQFPFPWMDMATAKILTCEEITLKLGIKEIRGQVECTKCHQTSTLGFDLKEAKLISDYIKDYQDKPYYPDIFCYKFNVDGYLSPDQWLNPELPPCPNTSCCCSRNADDDQGQGGLKPVIEIDYEKINWLFLFVSDTIGCCSVEQLDFFCKHNMSDCHDHLLRAGGVKRRLVYLTYLTICNQNNLIEFYENEAIIAERNLKFLKDKKISIHEEEKEGKKVYEQARNVTRRMKKMQEKKEKEKTMKRIPPLISTLLKKWQELRRYN